MATEYLVTILDNSNPEKDEEIEFLSERYTIEDLEAEINELGVNGFIYEKFEIENVDDVWSIYIVPFIPYEINVKTKIELGLL